MTKVKYDGCLSCGKLPTYPYLDSENRMKTTVLCGRDTVQIRPSNSVEISFEKLAAQMAKLGYQVKGNPYLLSIDMTAGERIVIFKDGRALIHGTKDLIHAKSIYQRIFG